MESAINFFFPTLQTLRQQYPQAAIDVLVEPRAKAAYRVCKNVDNVLIFDYRDRSSLADYLNLLGIIRDREYDASLSLGTAWVVELIMWLNGIPTRVGYQEILLFISLIPWFPNPTATCPICITICCEDCRSTPLVLR